MQKHELIRQIKPVLDGIVSTGISLSDIRNFEIYSEFERMKGNGVKTEYAAHCISSRFHCSKSKVYSIAKEMTAEVVPAVTAEIQ